MRVGENFFSKRNMTHDVSGINSVKRIVFVRQFFRSIMLLEFHDVADVFFFGQGSSCFHARCINLEAYNPTAYAFRQADSVAPGSTSNFQDR